MQSGSSSGNEKRRYRVNEQMVYREEDDGAFLFDPQTGCVKFMNWSAREVFLILKQGHSLEAAASHLGTCFPEAGQAQIKQDIDALIERLCADAFVLPIT